MNTTDTLIGSKFKRDKYGLTNWTDRIVSIFLTYETKNGGNKPVVNIIDTRGNDFPLNDIILVE